MTQDENVLEKEGNLENNVGAQEPSKGGLSIIEFRGTAWGYFKIWIVNILLSVLTLGIYAAWAKVRNKRYFYNNTYLDGVNFEYHAKPWSIFISRIALLVLFGAISIGGVYLDIHYPPDANDLVAQLLIPSAILTILFLGLFLPWAWVRGMSFNARNSSFGNVHFSFQRAYSFPYLMGVCLLFFPPSWLFFPFWVRGYHRFRANHHRLGDVAFSFGKVSLGSYVYFLIWLGLAMVGAGLLIFLMVTSYVSSPTISDISLPLSLIYVPSLTISDIFLPLSLMFVFMINFVRAHYFRLFWNNLRAANGVSFLCNFTVTEFAFKILFVNFIAIILSFGLLLPWAKVRKVRFLTQCIKIAAPAGAIESVIGRSTKTESAIGAEYDAAEGFDFDVGLI